MVSAIILLLAVTTAALVIGVFLVALNELNHIDEIAEPADHASEMSN